MGSGIVMLQQHFDFTLTRFIFISLNSLNPAFYCAVVNRGIAIDLLKSSTDVNRCFPLTDKKFYYTLSFSQHARLEAILKMADRKWKRCKQFLNSNMERELLKDYFSKNLLRLQNSEYGELSRVHYFVTDPCVSSRNKMILY